MSFKDDLGYRKLRTYRTTAIYLLMRACIGFMANNKAVSQIAEDILTEMQGLAAG